MKRLLSVSALAIVVGWFGVGPIAVAQTPPPTPADEATPTPSPAPKPKATTKHQSKQDEQTKKLIERRKARAKVQAAARKAAELKAHDERMKLLEVQLKEAQVRGAQEVEMARIRAEMMRQQALMQAQQLERERLNAAMNPPVVGVPGAGSTTITGTLRRDLDAGAAYVTGAVGGWTYQLDLIGRPDLLPMVERLDGNLVTVSGRVRVPGDVGIPERRIISVESLAVARPMAADPLTPGQPPMALPFNPMP